MTEIKYTGTQNNILEIISSLPGKCKTVRTCGKSLIIPTAKGAKQVFKGDTIEINGDSVCIIDGEDI